jgi:putative transcriptional regulator
MRRLKRSDQTFTKASQSRAAAHGFLGKMPSILDIPFVRRDNTNTGSEKKTMAGLQLNNRLRVARAERNLSQGELAELVGVTRQTISSIETGQYCPSALLALRLAVTLGKRFEDLFFLEEVSS